MNDEAALLAAILANPDEDTPRLMFADWLDENGHPHRAEFIRVQIEVTRLPDAERKTPHYRARLTRFRQLVAGHAAEWAVALGVPATRVLFRRGFIEEGTFTAAELPTADNPALLREPLRRVRVSPTPQDGRASDSGEAVLRRLASWPGAGRFHTLTFRELGLRLGAVEDHFAEPPFADLRVLELPGCRFPPELVVALAECPHLTKLEHLELGAVRLTPEQALALARTPNLPNLRSVDLYVRYLRAEREDGPDPILPAINELKARYGNGVWASPQ